VKKFKLTPPGFFLLLDRFSFGLGCHRSVASGIRGNPIFRAFAKVDDNLMTIVGQAGRVKDENLVLIEVFGGPGLT
jgi:hypothetical protein